MEYQDFVRCAYFFEMSILVCSYFRLCELGQYIAQKLPDRIDLPQLFQKDRDLE